MKDQPAAVAAGSPALARPSSSSAPAGASWADSQLGRMSRNGHNVYHELSGMMGIIGYIT